MVRTGMIFGLLVLDKVILRIPKQNNNDKPPRSPVGGVLQDSNIFDVVTLHLNISAHLQVIVEHN